MNPGDVPTRDQAPFRRLERAVIERRDLLRRLAAVQAEIDEAGALVAAAVRGQPDPQDPPMMPTENEIAVAAGGGILNLIPRSLGYGEGGRRVHVRLTPARIEPW